VMVHICNPSMQEDWGFKISQGYIVSSRPPQTA
jgi:hypothetical protein